MFRGKPLSDIIYDIKQEKVGKSSFFRYYGKGEVSTMTCKTRITNYTMDANILSLPDLGESIS